MLDIAALVAGLAVLIIPGIFLWRAVFPEDDLVDRLTWGATAGLALAVLIAFYVSRFRLSLFWPLWMGVVALSLLLAWLCSPRRQSPAPDRTQWWLALLLAMVAVSRFAPTFFRDIPLGWDPSFHLLLAKKLLLTDKLFYDWTPFETVALNYPLGSHLLIVVLSRLTSIPLHRVFQLLVPALGVVTTAQVYGLARRIFRSSEVALYSAFAYGMWAFLGSIAYYNWGGLPNQLGMVFLIPVIAIMAQPACHLRSAAAVAVFLAAMFVTHHHVALVAGITLGVAAGYLLLSPGTAEPGKWGKLRALALGVAGSVGLASAYLVPEAMKAARIGDTDALRFQSTNSILLLMAGMGVVFVAFAICGVVLSWMRDAGARAGMLLAMSLALVAAYLLCGPVYQAYALHHWGEERAALEPSRFITDLVYLLSVFAGYAMYRLAARYRLELGTAFAIALLLALSNIPLWRESFAPDRDPDRWRAYAWIQQHTPAETIVLTSDAWAPYATWRRTLLTPLPASEPRAGDNDARRAAAALSAGHPPLAGAVVEVIAPGGKWRRGSVIWKSPSGWSIVRQWPQTEFTATAPR
ncbi:MAG: hypothetical protein WCC59_16270 [Terriglobales bacterium]